ncbi:MAG: hypothetical protein Q8888_02390 [Vigna little leaf phytoplasma]|nr:hypothetical protein [Vigna little leaf phytoplasma]
MSQKKQKIMILLILALLILLLWFHWLRLMKIVKKPGQNHNQMESTHHYSIPASKVEIQKEYFSPYGSFREIPLNKDSFPQPYRNSEGKWMLANVGEGRHLIEATYTFYGFNGLKNCQYPDKVPQELNSFVQKKPFSEWYHEWDQRGIDNKWILTKNEAFYKIPPTLETDKNASLLTKENISDEGIMIYKHANTINLLYNGPKYVLDRDQDFYLCEIPIPFRDLDKTFFDDRYYTQNYYLHFNPVKNYLTLYTEKMNMEKEINEKQ